MCVPRNLRKRGGNVSVVVPYIRAIIKQKGLKNKAVAEKAGYTEQEFSNMLNERKIVNSDDVLRVATALDVTPNDLFGIKCN